MTDVRRVIPRQAMKAPQFGILNAVVLFDNGEGTRRVELLDDAEFVAAFRPAEHLDRLLDAVRWEAVKHGKRMYGPHPCICSLCTALRQWEAP